VERLRAEGDQTQSRKQKGWDKFAVVGFWRDGGVGCALWVEVVVGFEGEFDNLVRGAIKCSMSVATEKIERAIRKLPVDEMISMHEHLIASLHDKADAEGLDPAFRQEVARRVKEIDAGTAKGEDAFRALEKM
jgi:putative addiction module component (TIGR02574 family)